jgi:hypothetical protein
MKRRLNGLLHPAVLASLIFGALAGGYSFPVSASWKCEAPTVTFDDGCTCIKNGCKPAKEGVEDPFYVCNYTKSSQCPTDFQCPPLDACYKAMMDEQ